MDTSSLAPWNWFKSKQFSEKDNEHYRNSIQSNFIKIMQDFFKDFNGEDTALTKILKKELYDKFNVLPRVDISETDNEYIVEAELPGIKPEDVDISINRNNILIIKGKRETKKEEKERNFHRIERSSGSFERSINLPEDCNIERIDASFKNGILKITIPHKKLTEERIKKIQIHS